MDTIDEDSSGEVDWIEYLDMMLSLQDGSADKNVAEFLTRHPIILLVAPEKEPNDYVCTMLYRAAKDAKIDVTIIQKYTADAALKFMKELPTLHSKYRSHTYMSACGLTVLTCTCT